MRALRYFSVLVFVLGAIWILSTSSLLQTCIDKQTAAESEQAKENPPTVLLSFTNKTAVCIRCTGHILYEYRDFVTAVATVFIAAFTFTLWWSTNGMLRIARLQASDTKAAIAAAQTSASAALTSAETGEKALFAANRPLITIGELELVESDKSYIGWGMRNSGQGFAVVTDIKVECVIQGLNPPRIFSRNGDEWRGNIEPGQTSSGHKLTTVTLQARIKDILAGRLLLYFKIELGLMDVFENRSSARFPFLFDSETNSFKPTSPLVIGDEKDDSQA
jgi:hypothetical protein